MDEMATAQNGTGLVLDAFFYLHDVRFGPEVAERMGVIEKALEKSGLLEKVVRIEPRTALASDIYLVHSPKYFQQVKKDVEFGAGELSTGDTEVSEHSLEVAMKATGGVLEAVDAVVKGKVRNAFCCVRPPGHHATPTKGMGFCVFNHVAIAARYARKMYRLERVLIVDWDVHHGNGTQEAFYEDGGVLFFSSHQELLYPGTGRREETGSGKGAGLIVNAPLPEGSGYVDILAEMDTRLEEKVREFRPELVLISAGFDARAGDPMGDFTLSDEEFGLLTRKVVGWAEEFAAGRLVSVLEGGYNLETLGGAAAAHVGALLEG